MLKIDARGFACPVPVLMTKNGLAESPEGIEVMVDNETAKENITRFAVNNKYTVEAAEMPSEEYTLTIKK